MAVTEYIQWDRRSLTSPNKAPLALPFVSQETFTVLGFDGPSDLPEAEHPNLAAFSFNFASTKPSADIVQDLKLHSPLLKGRSVSESAAKGDSNQRKLETSGLPRLEPNTSPYTPTASNPDRKFVNYSRPSLLISPSPELQEPGKGKARAASLKSPAASKSVSPVSQGSTPPRSAKRVVKPDDSWLKVKQKETAVKQQLDPDDPLVPAPLRVRSRTLTVKKSREFLAKVQPLASPPKPVPKFGVKAVRAKPKALQLPDSEEFAIEEPDENTPRITRENILKHILSEESLRTFTQASFKTRLEVDQEEEKEQEVPEMSMLHPESAAAMTEHRLEAVRLAQAQEKTVLEKCKRSDEAVPGYTFDELIGKGSYGRVYKGRQTSSAKVVAIKVLDVDEADFHAFGESKDEQIRDFNREIRILRQAQESGAPNMNHIIEALPVHSQLWMICEYCPGGSVKTLMRATHDRLVEKYIVVVARELAKALNGLHEAGIMHRDVKAANVLVHEEGRLQLCDFGVANVLEQRTDKRRTFIGTLHWMPPELWSDDPEYSDEVDVWEYGVTLYECALGKPPNSDLRERQQLQSRMRRLKQPINLPEHEEFSEGLRSLVRYTLTPDAKTRPSMKDVLEHDFLRETEESHPTTSLIQLVQVYYQWLHSGGQRASLFMPGGAVITEASDSIITPSDEWNFSTTDNFENRNSTLLEIPTLSELSPTDSREGESTPKGSRLLAVSTPPLKDLTNVQKLNFESRVKRGADLSNLFDQERPSYEYKIKRDFVPAVEERRISDLPFRAMAEDRPTSIASNVIDLGDFDSEDYAIAAPKKEEAIRLADAATIRAKRGDSKGPRDSSTAMSLTARRTSSAADEPGDQQESSRVTTHDFSFPPKEWADEKSPGESTDLQSLTEKASIRDASRKTMEWTFATAMPASPEKEEEEQEKGFSPEVSKAKLDKNAKHATLDWSFSNAMAEADEVSTYDGFSTSPAKTTPRRPAPLLRTMTQPVTSADFHHAEEIERPSTARSEAYSESSMSSADFDPFSLDQGQEIPDPTGLDEMNVSSFYNTRGRTMIPEHIVPYKSTVAGPAPYMLGRPARIGEEGHPGPSSRTPPNPSRSRADNDKKRGKKSTSSSSSAGRPTVYMPEAVPPSEAAMAGDAPSNVVEDTLSRLLGGLQQSLAGAAQGLDIMKKNKEKRKTRRSSAEWEDEE